MTPVRDQVAEEVRALLARRRLSARSAAARLDWTPMYLSRRMRGLAPFNVDDLAALADLLGVPVSSFFAGLDSLADSAPNRPMPDFDKPIYAWPKAA